MGVYESLEVTKYINAAGNGTSIGGSIMRPEVLAAMEEASRSFVRLPELLSRAGERVAQLAGVEAAYITSGAAAGVAISVAACMTGTDSAKVHQLPDTTGMKNEVIIQVMQRNFYELMIRLAGAKLIEVGLANRTYPWHLESAITDKTAAIVHFCAYSPPTDLPIEDVISIAHKHDVPVIVDAAAEFPPFSVLRKYADLGADLTIFSGGKGIRGPQSSGIVLGRQDLIDAVAMNSSPDHGIGRPMKVGKEEAVGLVTALELFSVKENEDAELDGCEQRTSYVVESLNKIPGVRAYRGFTPPASTGRAVHPDGVPIAHVEWEQGVIPLSIEAAAEALGSNSPHIIVASSLTGLMICPHTLEPGEERVVAEAVSELFRRASN